jgi:O-acetylhomoserine/O-acetylserine sulfhydrylase-like pyridoxal-dependent enzyme
MTHATIPAAEAWTYLGSNEALVMVSVSVEEVKDLRIDLQNVLDAI